ncbi:MAG: acyltransferase family protein [Alphaproteobacteria bacterium]|nr:acyltransferase family protein [Alphaproteobacteria bacterium]
MCAGDLPTDDADSPGGGRAIPSLTGLRFAAAISVALAHTAVLSPQMESLKGLLFWLTTGGWFGMSLFFVLSGFVIYYNYSNIISQGKTGLGRFFWARFSRLYPMFFIILIIDVFLGPDLLVYFQGNDNSDAVAAIPYFMLFVQSWFYSVGAHHSLIYQIGHDLPLTWSISTEWFFYLAFPVLLLGFLRLKTFRSVLIVAVLFSCFWAIVCAAAARHVPWLDRWSAAKFGPLAVDPQDGFSRWLLYFSPYMRIGEFFLGCLTAKLYMLSADRFRSAAENTVGRCVLAAALVAFPILLYLMYSPDAPFPLLVQLKQNFGLAPLLAVIMFCCARYDTGFGRIMGSRPLVMLGEASYSIYLVHILILFAAAGSGQKLPDNYQGAIFLFLRMVAALAIICIVALGTFRYVEAPARRFLRALPARAGWQAAVIAGVLAVPLLLLLNTSRIRAYDPFAADSNINVLSATYGGNCKPLQGNMTAVMRRACNGKELCKYDVDSRVIGDTAPGCAKRFEIEYVCLPAKTALIVSLGSDREDASGSTATLSCAKP